MECPRAKYAKFYGDVRKALRCAINDGIPMRSVRVGAKAMSLLTLKRHHRICIGCGVSLCRIPK